MGSWNLEEQKLKRRLTNSTEIWNLCVQDPLKTLDGFQNEGLGFFLMYAQNDYGQILKSLHVLR